LGKVSRVPHAPAYQKLIVDIVAVGASTTLVGIPEMREHNQRGVRSESRTQGCILMRWEIHPREMGFILETVVARYGIRQVRHIVTSRGRPNARHVRFSIRFVRFSPGEVDPNARHVPRTIGREGAWTGRVCVGGEHWAGAATVAAAVDRGCAFDDGDTRPENDPARATK